MSKLLLVALTIAMVLLLASPAQGQTDWHIACDLQDQAEVLSSLSDNVRWKYYEECASLPTPPQGFTWAEDVTLVPLSFYA